MNKCLQMLAEGKKVRLSGWGSDGYIHLKGGRILDEHSKRIELNDLDLDLDFEEYYDRIDSTYAYDRLIAGDILMFRIGNEYLIRLTDDGLETTNLYYHNREAFEDDSFWDKGDDADILEFNEAVASGESFRVFKKGDA